MLRLLLLLLFLWLFKQGVRVSVCVFASSFPYDAINTDVSTTSFAYEIPPLDDEAVCMYCVCLYVCTVHIQLCIYVCVQCITVNFIRIKHFHGVHA